MGIDVGCKDFYRATSRHDYAPASLTALVHCLGMVHNDD